MKILLIDNYDSFTFNLYQLVGAILKSSLIVKRNDEITLTEIIKQRFDRIIISPGPGSPYDPKYFGICREVILKLGSTIPILGVCLGMQGIATCFGGVVIKAKIPMHGKTSKINHNEKDLFQNIPHHIYGMRYHSLIVDKTNLPRCIEITAMSADTDEIMALRHKTLPVFGVQFHPESFATEYGKQLMTNFLFQKV